MSIHILPANRPANRFYRGGSRIASFRAIPDDEQYVPEDWLASVTTVFGDPSLGLTSLADGRTLRQAVADDPERWLGAAHVSAWGSDSKLLVKLLDAGQRLPVHAHPATAFAQEHLLRPHGKAEAWHILHGGEVHLGLREDVSMSELSDLVAHQRTGDLLDLLHTRTVEPGDTVFVPPGVLHAIGQDVFLAEVQEPEDLSILLEWHGFAIDGSRDGHLGLGFDAALTAVERERMTEDRLGSLIARTPTLPASADEYFRLSRRAYRPGDDLEPGFAVVIVLSGAAALTRGPLNVQVQAGNTLLLEYEGGPTAVDGEIEIIEFRPPLPAVRSLPSSTTEAARTAH
ncbi:class I mannose-6-phosphate isomerase [Microbacterium sp. SSW1-49]|uniref:Class I mannose-6-phosphate isomerase n=1 Tax=Microbacterium croceum TaxID=2851645 RepID=A0ABT0FA36_9MICO|nr:class I mannose-6-phosphate isomerase [Microbacterium croceum]MCK2034930.1 class I mannose-6-phosphate isomerase [Microbacterium croceum]